MDKFLKFLTSPTGKWLVAAIVLAVVSYIGWVAYDMAQQKKKYNGMLHSEVSDGIKRKMTNDKIATIKVEDTNYDGTNLSSILEWYDNNFDRKVEQTHIDSYLIANGIESKYRMDFNKLLGVPVKLTDYA